MPGTPAIVWFRQDLRLRDNPALDAALTAGRPIVPVFVSSPDAEGDWAPGAASRWWLHRSLAALDESLRRRGSRLVVRWGVALAELRRLVRETGAGAVFWNRRFEPAAVARDGTVKESLLADGLEVRSFNASLLQVPGRVLNKSGAPFQVFTPFWKHVATLPVRAGATSDRTALPSPDSWPASEPVASPGSAPTWPRDREFAGCWCPGEAGAQAALEAFLADGLERYATDRDRPDRAGTSRLSPHLRFGELGPVQVWQAVKRQPAGVGPETFLRELGWREFAHHLLFHFPETPAAPLRREFARFPWVEDAARLEAWQHGRTGYPIVDAGMRQLRRTGWMHNRVRMIAASFLVKHLLQPWQAGARWFWETLVDADLANNTLGWQWSAGCGADAAPYFRVFNPVLQGVKFDPAGDYVRAFVPELAALPPEHIHAPWAAPASVLAAAAVRLGGNYPAPIVEHRVAREAALAAYARLRDTPAVGAREPVP